MLRQTLSLLAAAASLFVALAASPQQSGQHQSPIRQTPYQGLTGSQAQHVQQRQQRINNSLGVQMGNAYARAAGIREFQAGAPQPTTGARFSYGAHPNPHARTGTNVGSGGFAKYVQRAAPSAQAVFAQRLQQIEQNYENTARNCKTSACLINARGQAAYEDQLVEQQESNYNNNLQRGSLLGQGNTGISSGSFQRGSLLNAGQGAGH
ncbi:MAG TPA: hypothetical protein VME40_10125 [Caulobacteraceae bacterium]|nr:hypothetical protein [Caulobacteraceae bacterium]